MGAYQSFADSKARQHFIESGRPPSDLDEDGRTFLGSFVRHGDLERVRVLLDKWPEAVNVCNGFVRESQTHGWTALHYAVRFSHVDIVRMLLARGADVNAVSVWAMTPLRIAIHYECKAEIIRLLLEAGATFELPIGPYPAMRKTILQLCCNSRDARLLLAAGASVAPEDIRSHCRNESILTVLTEHATLDVLEAVGATQEQTGRKRAFIEAIHLDDMDVAHVCGEYYGAVKRRRTHSSR